MRTLLAGILGGIAMYVWSTIAHVATPLATVGIGTLPDEATVISSLEKSVGDGRGLFLFPNQTAAGANAPKEGPFGFLVYRSHVSYALKPSNLVIEFGTELTESILAAFLLSLAVLSTYIARVGFVTLIGVTASIATNLSYWNWYGFSGRYSLAQIFMVVVGYVAAGLVIAWLVPGRVAAASPA
jgi:hypothetical protein